MALISPRPFPDGARLPVSRIELQRVQSINTAVNGAIQVMEQGDPLWTGRFQTEPLLWSRRRLWSAWGRSLREGMDPFMAYDWLASYPIAYGQGVLSLMRAIGGAFDGTGPLNDFTATTIQISGLPAHYRASAGDRVSFPWNGSRSYHEVMEAAVGTGAGIITLAVEPPVPTGPAPVPGVPVDLVRAPIVMRLRPGTFSEPDGAGALSISFEGIQDRTPVYQPESLALRARMTTLPDNRLYLMDGLIYRLKAAGIWDKLDALWLLAAHDATSAQINWISERYNLVAVNSPTFSPGAGMSGNGVSSYFRTGFVSTYGTKATGASASVGVVINVAGTGADSSFIGVTQIPGDGRYPGFRIMGRYRGGGAVTSHTLGANSINTSAGGVGALPALGSLTVSRTAEEGFDFYHNGGLYEHRSIGSGTSPLELYVGAENFNGGPAFFASDRMTAAFVGGGLTASEVSALHFAIRSYLDGIGAP